MVFWIVISIVTLLVIIASIEVQGCIQKKIDYEKIKRKSDVWNILVNGIFDKQKVYYIQKSLTRLSKCDKCDKNREVDAVRPDGTTVKVKCSCDKFITDYEVANFVKRVNFICCKNGYIQYYANSSPYNPYHFSIYDDAIKNYENPSSYSNYNEYLFTSKDDAEKFAEYLRKIEGK